MSGARWFAVAACLAASPVAAPAQDLAVEVNQAVGGSSEEIAGAGTTWSGYWFIDAGDGRRIYWSYLYKGYGALIASLQAHRPDLDLPFGRG